MGPGTGDRRAGGRRHDRRKVAGERAELAPHGRGERGLDALVELLQGQPPLGVVLAQYRGHRLAVGVSGAQVRSSHHVVLRIPHRAPDIDLKIYLDMVVGKSSAGR
jgi:hypothetical protein